MATFESSLPQPAPCEVQKYSIRRLEPTIQNFLKIIQIDIDRLRKHTSNFEKFSKLNVWNGLHKENINATRTVQQIKANIKEIENTRKRIVDEDVMEFDKKTSGIKYDAILAIQEFLCSVQSEESIPESPSGSTPEGDDPLGSFSIHRSSSDHMNISLHQLQIESEYDNSETSESWKNLHQPAPREVQKFSIRRLEPTIQKFLKIIQIDIDRLRKHKSNLEKFSQLNDWNGLHKENINATRTVQQIKANIKEIENTRKRIVDEDVEEFDKKTSGMKYDATLAIQEFLCSVQSEESTPESPSGSTPEGDDPLGSFSMHRSSSDHMNISLHQLQIESEHDSSETSESWENPHQPAPCEVQKYSIRRLEPTVQKILKIIQIDIDRLRKHKSNLEKFSQLNDWNGLHKENINATRTVQQIKANIKEIENTRKRIVDEDVEEFDKKTSGMKYDATLAIQEFLCSVQSEESTPESPSGSTPEGDDPLGSFSIHRSSSDHMNISLHQLQIESEHDNSETIESWENLHQNLVESNTMIHEFSSAVQNQQESIDRMEDNIEKAHENVRSGVTNLSKASKYKAAAFPVAGALIGTVIGGPVGFLAGLKIGSVAAIGGGAAGFLGGRFYKKRQDKVVEAEMKI